MDVNKSGLQGPNGLIIAIIAQAVKDTNHKNEATRQEALQFLGGPTYRHYLDLLGLNPDLLPKCVRYGH